MSSPTRSATGRQEQHASETTPLLVGVSNSAEDHGESGEAEAITPGSRQRWATYSALGLLFAGTLLVMVVGFFVPESIQQYAIQATQVDIQSVVPEFTEDGARVSVRGVFTVQAPRVESSFIRNLGVFGTWIAKEVETGEAQVKVTLPEYDNVVLGTATLPPIKVDVRNGHSTKLNFVADLQPPQDVDGVRSVADDWLSGRLDHLTVVGEAKVGLRSGMIHLPSQTILHSLRFQGDQIPQIPEYNITKLLFREVQTPDQKKYMEADASVTIRNEYPLDLTIPPLGFSIFVDNCLPTDPRIFLADARVQHLHIRPKQNVQVNVTGLVRELPESLTAACPGSDRSPLDDFLGGYIHGEETIVFIQGTQSPSPDTPKWISDIMSSITVPVPFPGRTFDNLIRNFTLADLRFKLPDQLADPDSPASLPTISAKIQAVIALPQEMNFPIDVGRVRAFADVFYRKNKLGELNLSEWQDAKSTPLESDGEDSQPLLLVESSIDNAPLDITDDDTFTQVVRAMLFGRKEIQLQIKANVDVQVSTTLGELTVRQIPAEGTVPIKPVSSGNLNELSPQVGNLTIIETTKKSMTLQAVVNFTNPSKYSAVIPYADVNILVNNTILGHATAQNLTIVPGPNENSLVQVVWDPSSHGGDTSLGVGRELLSQFVSGYNISLIVKTHSGTIPSQPRLGKALAALRLVVPTSSIKLPKNPDSGDGDDDDNNGDDEDNDRPHFIKGATMHLLSSAAEFLLQSPLTRTILYITAINATALYKDDEVGKLSYDLPFAVHPGETLTPLLPVDWSLGSVGYDALKKALGGQLKLHAEANVRVNIGDWNERIWYKGKGIGTKVRL